MAHAFIEVGGRRWRIPVWVAARIMRRMARRGGHVISDEQARSIIVERSNL